MRNGLKWWQLGLLAFLGAVSLGVQFAVGQSVEHYTVEQTSVCSLASWSSGSDTNALEGTFKCGQRTVKIKDGSTLSAYLNKGHMTCTFKRGDQLHDESQDCHA